MRRYLVIFIILFIAALSVVLFFVLPGRRGGDTPRFGTLPPPSDTPQGGRPGAPGAPGGDGEGPGLGPGGVAARLELVAENPTIAYFADQKNSVTLVQPDGQIVRIGNRGEPTVLSGTTIANLGKALFSYDGEKVLVSFGNPNSPELSLFDIKTKSWQPLEPGIRNPAWSPEDHRIAYQVLRGGESVLETLDLGDPKAKPQELLKINAQDLVLLWNQPDAILFGEKTDSLTLGSLWGFDLKNKVLALLVKDQPGLEGVWSASGDWGLVFSGLRRTEPLSLVDKEGGVVYGLRFATLAQKCFFVTREKKEKKTEEATSTKEANGGAKKTTEDVLYCAIPRDTQKFLSNPLPDAYLKKALFTDDDFYKIKLSDGNATPLFVQESEKLDASLLGVSGGRLFFVNRFDQKLYALSLGE